MNTTRIPPDDRREAEQKAEQVRRMVFEFLDGEPNLDGMGAGLAASRAEKAVLSVLLKRAEVPDDWAA